jgi:hypothetical protein
MLTKSELQAAIDCCGRWPAGKGGSYIVAPDFECGIASQAADFLNGDLSKAIEFG